MQAFSALHFTHHKFFDFDDFDPDTSIPHCGRVSDTSTSSTETCAGAEHRSAKDAGVKNADCSPGGRGIMPSGRAAAHGDEHDALFPGEHADDEAEDEAGKMQSKPPTVESLTPRIKNISESRRQQLQEIIKAGQSLKELKKRNNGNETSSTALKGGYSNLGTMTGTSPTSGSGAAAGRDSSEMGVMHQHGNMSSANATKPHMPRTKTLSTDGDRSCRNKNSSSFSGLQMTPKSSMKESDSVSCHHSNSSSQQYKDFSNGGSTSTSPRYTMSNRTNSNCNTNSTSGSTTEVVVIRQNPDGTTQQEVVTQPRVNKKMLTGASSPSCTQDHQQEERNAVAVSAQELNPVGRKPGATNSKHEDASTEPTRTPRSNSTARFRDLESSSSCSSVQDQTPVNSQIAVYTTGLGCAAAGGLQHPGMGMMNNSHVEAAPGMQMVHQMHNLHMHHPSGMNFGMNAGVVGSSSHPPPHGHGQHQHHSHSDYLDESPMSVLSQQSNRPPHVVEHFVKKASSFFGVNAPATMLTSTAGGGSRTTGTSHMQQQVVDPLPTGNSVDERRSAGPDLLRTPTPASKKSNSSSRVQQQESVELVDRPSPQTARPAKQVRGSGKGINSCCSSSPKTKSGAKSISNGSTSGVRRVLLSNEHQHDTEKHLHNNVPLKQASTPQQLSAENIRQWESINKNQTVHQQQMQLQKNQNANSSVTRKLTSRSLQNLNLQQGGTRAIGLNHARIAMAVDRADKTAAAQLNMNPPRGMLMNAAGGSATAPNGGGGAGSTGSSSCGNNRFQQCGSSSSGSQSCPHHRSATLGRHINPTHGAHQLHNRNDFRNRQQLLSSINEDDYSSSDDFSKQGENTTCSQKLQAKSPNSLRKQCRSQTAGACCPGGGSGSSSSTSGKKKNGKSNANGSSKPGNSSSASCNPHDSTTTRRGSRAASRSSSERSSFAVCFSDSSHRDSLLRDLDEVDSRRSGETGRDNLLVHHGNQNMANCALPPPKIISSAANSKENYNAGNHGATTSSSKRIHHLGGHKHESKKHRSGTGGDPKGTTPPSCRGVAPALCSSANLSTKMRVGGMSFVPPRGRSGLVADDGSGHQDMMQMISTTTTSTSHHGFPRGAVPSGVKQKGSAATEFLFV